MSVILLLVHVHKQLITYSGLLISDTRVRVLVSVSDWQM